MRLVSFLFSIPFMVVLILVFAIAIGAATFIETARAVVYNAWWMTALYILLSINLTANIIRFRLWRKEKSPALLFHAGFLVILLGAAITRTAGHDYQLHFREGETTDRALSSRAFLQMDVKHGDRTVHAEKKLLLSTITPNRIRMNVQIGGHAVRLRVKEYLPENADAGLPPTLVVEAASGEYKEQTTLSGRPDAEGTPEILNLGDLEVTLKYGAKSATLPFALELEDFIIDRYPGSAMPSGFASEVIVHDAESGDFFPFRIYMNHILRYRGYRFFQSSYDDDEQGSILSVSFDPGTLPTYLGYAVVALGLVINFFNPKSRFRKLGKIIQARESGILLILIAAFSIPSFARGGGTDDALRRIDVDHAKAFGTLVVQDARGRMKPVNSLSHEWMRRLGHPEKTAGVSPDQFLLAAFVEPGWIESTPENRDMNVFLQGGDFRLFPLPDAPDQRWHVAGDPALHADSVSQGLVLSYREAVLSAIASKDWKEADAALGRIGDYQRRTGAAVMPTDFRIHTEILYNRLAIFQRLGVWLPILGGLSVLLILVHAVFGFSVLRKILQILSGILLAGFFLETTGLVLRWIASGHAPWANKYESMIFISWAVMLAGLLFARNARLAFGGGALFSGLILALARTPGFDPKITNLPPVLKSHWLITHVSIITSSYGFFGLAALLGLIVLLLYAMSTKRLEEPVRLIADRMAVVIERSLLVGLTLVMIGNFLGAVWANESWGRYWGWDPKETWTLVVILVYAVVLHLRLYPKWGGVYPLAAGSVLAFLCVLMTYFGVNLYLTGMHSYAGGERPPVPVGLFIGLGVLIALIGVAGVRRKG